MTRKKFIKIRRTVMVNILLKLRKNGEDVSFKQIEKMGMPTKEMGFISYEYSANQVLKEYLSEYLTDSKNYR